MTGRHRRQGSTPAIAAMIVALATAIGCSACAAATGARFSRRAPAPSLAPVPDYLDAIAAAQRHHLRVWIDADMVKRWEHGPASFRAAIARLAVLANRPGVAGIKIADELGYHDGMDSAAKIRRFLSTTSRAIRDVAPHALILADMVVPALGCLPGHQPSGSAAAACAAAARARYPQLALRQIDGYLHLHAIGVLDLSTGLLPDSTYAAWGTTRDAAQQAAWTEADRRGWPRLVRLQARKALAHPGRYTGTPAQAAADLHTFVDVPLAFGAHAVDVWTWRQRYKGTVYRLMDPGMRPNALWVQLERRRRGGDVLITHMSPHSVESGVNSDLAVIATVFTEVFLPAGTG